MSPIKASSHQLHEETDCGDIKWHVDMLTATKVQCDHLRQSVVMTRSISRVAVSLANECTYKETSIIVTPRQ